MANIIRSEIHNITVKSGLFLSSFEQALEDLSSKIDNADDSERRVFDISIHGAETSIWFDSFDFVNEFSAESNFDNIICFLMAKDMPIQFIEDKEAKAIQSYSPDAKQRPKTPAHCIYIKDDQKLLIETTTNAPTTATLSRGLIAQLRIKSDDISFTPVYREDILERLTRFLDNVKSIELIDLKIQKYITKEVEDDGEILSLIANPNSKIGLKLSVETDTNWKKKAVDLFGKILHNKNERIMQNIKIEYDDERKNKETASLFENLVYLKVEKDFDIVDDISKLHSFDRIGYSKKVYRAMIESYRAKNDF